MPFARLRKLSIVGEFETIRRSRRILVGEKFIVADKVRMAVSGFDCPVFRACFLPWRMLCLVHLECVRVESKHGGRYRAHTCSWASERNSLLFSLLVTIGDC